MGWFGDKTEKSGSVTDGRRLTERERGKQLQMLGKKPITAKEQRRNQDELLEMRGSVAGAKQEARFVNQVMEYMQMLRKDEKQARKMAEKQPELRAASNRIRIAQTQAGKDWNPEQVDDIAIGVFRESQTAKV